MTASPECVAMVRQFEGFAAEAYADGLYCSIGYGHHGPEVKPGQRVTEPEACKLLEIDLARFAADVESRVHVRLAQQQFDALVCFTYNVGVGAFEKSTLLKLLNAGYYREAASQFLRWNKVAGVASAGLTNRRKAEQAMFLRGMDQ